MARFAYADPPYIGCSHLYKNHPDYAGEVDHVALLGRLAEYDGWALSLSSPSLRTILPLCPDDVRVMPWVKTFAVYKPGVTVAYAWEPVIVRQGRKRPKTDPTIRDWIAEPCTLRRGFVGAKPEAVCHWLFDVMGMQPDDQFDDLFPGSGAVGRAWESWRQQRRLPLRVVDENAEFEFMALTPPRPA